MSFKSKHRFEYRQKEANKVLEKYPNRVPIICEKLPSCKNVPDIDRYKYLVPGDMNFSQFSYVIRKRLNVDPHISIFFFVDGNVLVPTWQFFYQLYDDYKDKDGFLYIIYSGENTFG